jgi:hypothetical protein
MEGMICDDILDTVEKCNKKVIKNGKCVVHSGKICSYINEDGTKCKSQSRKSEFCISHGGGNRCLYFDDNKEKCKNVKMVQYLDMIFVLLMVDILNVIINIKMGNNVKHQLVKDITNVKNTEQDHVLEY